MPDFNVRCESVDVEQIMAEIRARIRDKRGVDYTEQQIRELAAVKLEKFLDPRGVRSDLVEQFKRREPLAYDPIVLPVYAFEDTTIYETHRGILRFIRRLLTPILKLFLNPNAIIHALHSQVHINALLAERDDLRERQRKERRETDALYYEVIHNLVFEMTKIGIEVKNLKMRVESLASRLEFNERRARALESVVVYKASSADQIEPGAGRSAEKTRASHSSAPPPTQSRLDQDRRTTGSGHAPSTGLEQAPSPGPGSGSAGPPEGPGQRSRRRRRRRGRRGGAPAVAMMGDPSTSSGQAPSAGPGQDLPTGSDQNASAGSGQAPDADASTESREDATPPQTSSAGSSHDPDRPDPDRETPSSGRGEPDPQ